jgi:tellurite resistance protein TerC
MNVPAWVWTVTIVGLLGLLLVDLLIVGRGPRQVTIREAAAWVVFYVICAGLFGAGVLVFSGARYAGEFFAGYITEYSLSVDNLFVFAVILSHFAVPLVHQQRALRAGIVAAMVMRGLLIFVGAVMIAKIGWVFYLFGGFLIVTAVRLARSGKKDTAGLQGSGVLGVLGKMRPARRRLGPGPAGQRGGVPTFVLVITIGVTDMVFAFDSIPAIFGLTGEPFLVFTANAFAVMGLRQLYFLLRGLLEKLVYLSFGLAVILGFIGVKLMLEALSQNSLPFVHGGNPLPVPTIGTGLSLVVIVGVLLVTAMASWRSRRRNAAGTPSQSSRV